MVPASRDFDQNVFLNCPFDNDYKPLFDAAIFAVQIAGFTPHCALEASNAGQARLDKIMDIISRCRYGIHDLSRTELSGNKLPRFNMPLELGLDLGCRRYGRGRLADKRLLVLDRNARRYQRFISDIAGQDIASHSGKAGVLIRRVRDWLSTESKIPTIPGGVYMFRRYRAFRADLPGFCRRQRLNPTQLTFGDFSALLFVWLAEKEN